MEKVCEMVSVIVTPSPAWDIGRSKTLWHTQIPRLAPCPRQTNGRPHRSREAADAVNDFTERCSWVRANDVNKLRVCSKARPVQRQHCRVDGVEES